MNNSVEIRSYNLKPRSRDKFRRLFIEEALPMLVRWNIDVVAFGPSLHDRNSYYLIRRFDSLDHLQRSEDAFYASPEWRKGPRKAILDCIKSYTSIVLSLDDTTVQALRLQYTSHRPSS